MARGLRSTQQRRLAWVIASVVAGSVATARADDGFYAEQTVGVARGHGKLAGPVGTTFHSRLGIGMRLGDFAIEPWLGSSMQLDRTGAFHGLLGGEPAEGKADLSAIGLDAKYIHALDHRLAMFVRAGPLVAEGTGALAGYRGRGIGMGGGMQLTGKVRALGFLWAPLFFTKRGPMVTGALFLDVGYDATFLRSTGRPPIDDGVAHLSLGFAMGTKF